MEPVKLIPAQDQDARLDACLRQAAVEPLADDGFSARVMGALPRRRRGAAPTWRVGVVLGTLVVALVIWGAELGRATNQGAESLASAIEHFDQPDLLLAIVIIIGVLAVTANDETVDGQ